MGCNKSYPAEIVRSIPEPQITEAFIPKRQKTKRVMAKEVGSINDHFKILKAIGTNNLGTMLYAQDIQSGTFRAIREVNKSLAKYSSNMLDEIEALTAMDHPNIIKVYQTIETSINYYVVFEYLDGGSLRSKVKRAGNEMLVSKYAHDIIAAIKYMHLLGYIHCNLSPEHIMFTNYDPDPMPKLIHFSYVQTIYDVQYPGIKNLSYVYMSPEIIRKSFNEKTDMWSLGVIIYELLVGKHPYMSKEKHDIIKEIYKGELDFNNPNFLSLSFSAQDFIKKLLIFNPEERLSAKDALIHPWLGLTTKEYYLTYEALMKLRSFRMRGNICQEIIKEINSKIEFKEHDIISLFKQLDSDCDGTISKDEVVKAFSQVGVDASHEIDVIMANLDIDLSGALDFTEIKIALIDWENELTKKNLVKAFKTENGKISMEHLRHKFNGILPHENINGTS
ncbi:hypothetical protein SteCoe_2376 [Stentor coeruleus]|uniref:Protein kinase domain-containing protein n=1 Tax=Stentor coeruleus TaxID=5963 RepID=A0A1R2CZR4_9CILI|nr:hypothetical protein SteCoe_2376 [Stentor coeruleus]